MMKIPTNYRSLKELKKFSKWNDVFLLYSCLNCPFHHLYRMARLQFVSVNAMAINHNAQYQIHLITRVGFSQSFLQTTVGPFTWICPVGG